MAILKCKMCGGEIVPHADGIHGTCDSCGGMTVLPNVSNEQIQRETIYMQAAQAMDNGYFEQAANMFRSLGPFKDALQQAYACEQLAQDVWSADKKTVLQKKVKKWVPSVVLLAAVLMIWCFAIPNFALPYAQAMRWVPNTHAVNEAAAFFSSMVGCIGVAMIAVSIVLYRKLPLIEAIKPFCIVLVVMSFLVMGAIWPLWIIVILLCIYYLKNLHKTNGKKGTAITCISLASVGLLLSIHLLLMR